MIALDASALLALLFREPGHERVAAALSTCCMSAVNLAETLGRFARDGKPTADLWSRLQASGVDWVPFDSEQARLAAELLPKTQGHGLSLGDRACLALAMTRRIPAMMADRSWANLELGVAVTVIR